MGEFEQCEGAQIECPIPSQLNRCLGRAAFLVNSTSLPHLDAELETRFSVPMSVQGQKRKSSVGIGMSAVGGNADVDFERRHVCL